ncbi:hypothetical protein NA57DRAFT_60952 [Rhizodiscina lignyota]|uniref:Uncharacterized protein n=1 Tax=Rhizodiscina lignyota TaxID=1504668 RepID=A0A9P4I964_9PEZI|nr:hypothetical protein NA57DRAFT_60952 [Rhizodiscina lignyota]
MLLCRGSQARLTFVLPIRENSSYEWFLHGDPWLTLVDLIPRPVHDRPVVIFGLSLVEASGNSPFLQVNMHAAAPSHLAVSAAQLCCTANSPPPATKQICIGQTIEKSSAAVVGMEFRGLG